MAGISINSSVASLRVLRELDRSSKTVSNAYERLSSGLRINRASDDPAGLSISSGINVDSRVYTQAIRNTNDGISLLNIAEGTTDQLTSILIRMRELATQSSNGTLSLKQRRALDAEGAALTNEFNRLVSSTRMNGLNLLSGSESVGIQLGYGSASRLQLALGDGLERNVGSGNYTSNAAAADGDNGFALGDVNGDGRVDVVSVHAAGNMSVSFGNGDGTFTSHQGVGTSQFYLGVELADFNSDGKLDIVSSDVAPGGGVDVYLNDGSGNFGAPSRVDTLSASSSIVADFNNDGKADFATTASGGGLLRVRLGNGDGTFQPYVATSNGAIGGYATTGDFNGDGFADIATSPDGGSVAVLMGNGVGGFSVSTVSAPGGSLVAARDFNLDGYDDLVITSTAGPVTLQLSRGDGTFQSSSFGSADPDAAPTVADLNDDGISDLLFAAVGSVKYALGRGDGTFGAIQDTSAVTGLGYFAGAGDMNGDGATDFIVGSEVMLADPTQTTTMKRMNLLSRNNARAAISQIDAALTLVQRERGDIGAGASRLGTALSNLQTARDGYIDASSRITDADVADESATLLRGQILQKAGSAVLAQSNLIPAIALQLLGVSNR